MPHFKTGGGEHLVAAGSIPVRLRRSVRKGSPAVPGRRAARASRADRSGGEGPESKPSGRQPRSIVVQVATHPDDTVTPRDPVAQETWHDFQGVIQEAAPRLFRIAVSMLGNIDDAGGCRPGDGAGRMAALELHVRLPGRGAVAHPHLRSSLHRPAPPGLGTPGSPALRLRRGGPIDPVVRPRPRAGPDPTARPAAGGARPALPARLLVGRLRSPSRLPPWHGEEPPRPRARRPSQGAGR